MEVLRRRLVSSGKNYLTFKAKQQGTFTFTGRTVSGITNSLSYSVNNGKTWTELPSGTASPTIQEGGTIMWKGENLVINSATGANGGIGKFSSTGLFEVSGNIMSLYYGDDFEDKKDLTGKNYIFGRLFYGNLKLLKVGEDLLPATTLSEGCYYYMFYGCKNLSSAPKLPATTLTRNCYSGMFEYCSLIQAPELPAMNLAFNCYGNMFFNCDLLTRAPELPALTLQQYCYYNMFKNCVNLRYVKAMFTRTSSWATNDWLYYVSKTGTFVKNSAATWTETGSSGVPSGWTIEYASS